MNTVKVGTALELIVSIDLMSKGYDVFRALSSSCPCDLIAMKDGKCLRVEVTIGKVSKNGTIGFNPHDPKNFDVIAVPVNNTVYYYPSVPNLPEFFKQKKSKLPLKLFRKLGGTVLPDDLKVESAISPA